MATSLVAKRMEKLANELSIAATSRGHVMGEWQKEKDRTGLVWRSVCLNCGLPASVSENPYGLPAKMGAVLKEDCPTRSAA